MDRATVIETLQGHESELRTAGVAHLLLFGSVARGEERAGSDVDLAAEFSPSIRRTLLTMVRLENRLSELLGVHVDLAPMAALKEPVRERVRAEAIHAF